ncbi:Kyphoscoliosis peptidase [Coniochaeta hoffmannii]|uniref:Kyphoscoliosis peptidase n=1 Tax=Coniochaeta hoffmannii TaxID=91930 RepID=A0AA38SCC5_9PEZI|nr:Kyphoscoliosis peptidase [Coniochaeta hoffmannii]
MAEVEEPRFTTLAERIAALNQQTNFQAPPPGAGRRVPPPRPSIPPSPARAVTAALENAPPLPRRTTGLQEGTNTSSPPLPGRKFAPPPLPSRSSTAQVSPALPPRRPSAQTLPQRRGSNASDISHMSTLSSASLNNTVSSATSIGSDQPTRRLPPMLDQAKLPPLPPTRRELEAKAKEEAASRAPLHSIKSAPVVPSLPPRLPSRPARSPAADHAEEQAPALPARRMPPPPTAWNRAKSAVDTPRDRRDEAPPPVPLSSRPTFAQIDAVATRSKSAAPASDASCLVCRDFSGPDAVAEKYPYWELPRDDPVGYLAHHLCSPFSSPTDKARAIFAWCHHNIAYDVHGFFNKCIPRGQTLDQTIFSGKAVCEGYAKVFEGVARRAGLECVVVGGHGKGYGHVALAPGQRPPPRDATGHAWNAVRIDGGEWKLIDACWGAGALGDDRQYNKRFEPQMFTLSNELFGLKHFPEDPRYFYRGDGRIPTWEEYIVGPLQGEQAMWYCHANKEGLNEFTFSPRERQIPVRSGEVVRFQFGKLCPHWDGEKHGRGKPLLLMIKITGPDGRGVKGRKDDMVVLDNDGFWWWVDIPARDLGAPGEKLQLLGLTMLNNEDARGMSKEKFLGIMGSNGMRSMSWDCVVGWELV